MFGMSVKSVPGCLVAMAPSLIFGPVAALPVPRPQTLCVFVCLPDPTGGALLAPVAMAAVASNTIPQHAANTRPLSRFLDLIDLLLSYARPGNATSREAAGLSRQHSRPARLRSTGLPQAKSFDTSTTSPIEPS